MPTFSVSSKLMLAMIAIAARVGACAVVYADVHVGPNFRVRVEDRGRPVKGLQVEIGGGIRAVTDKNGFAVFRKVRPGPYHLRAALDGGISDNIIVKHDGPVDVTVPLNWPSVSPMSVRSLKGAMRRLDSLPGQPEPVRSLDLFEGISGRFVRSEKTMGTGEFNFGSVAPGLYFLSLKSSGEEGLIAIAVDYGAPADHLDLDLGWTSCGLFYIDRSKCRQSDLQIEQLAGRVLDLSGAIIPGAKIFLLDPAGRQVEQLQSDNEGKFASARSLVGTYELVVSGKGFATYRRTVHAERNDENTPRSPLTVRLGLFGSCSANGPE